MKETTVGSGPWEGYLRRNDKWIPHYHGYFPDGAPEGASYLYFVDRKPDAQAFENYLAKHQGSVAFWLGGHTHTHPDDRLNGRSHIEQKWGTTFVNLSDPGEHSYIFMGRAGSIDHILVAKHMLSRVESDCVHVNTLVARQNSDHDPKILRLSFAGFK